MYTSDSKNTNTTLKKLTTTNVKLKHITVCSSTLAKCSYYFERHWDHETKKH